MCMQQTVVCRDLICYCTDTVWKTQEAEFDSPLHRVEGEVESGWCKKWYWFGLSKFGGG